MKINRETLCKVEELIVDTLNLLGFILLSYFGLIGLYNHFGSINYAASMILLIFVLLFTKTEKDLKKLR